MQIIFRGKIIKVKIGVETKGILFVLKTNKQKMGDSEEIETEELLTTKKELFAWGSW